MTAAAFENTVIYLIGFPGVGKYTIAKEIAKKADFIIVDNQLINNPVFSVVGADGITPLPAKVWDSIGKIRNVVMDTIEHASPAHFNFILTNAVMNTSQDRSIFNSIFAMFKRRNSRVFSVLLKCDRAEHEKRIVSEQRKERFKEIDPRSPKNYAAQGLITLTGADVIELDVTLLSPEKSAEIILDKINMIRSSE